MSDEITNRIDVASMFGHKSRRGLVRVRLGQEESIMEPSKAREIAGFLLESAGAAEADEAMMKVLERLDFSNAKQGQFLMALRSERGLIDRRAREEARRAVAEDQSDPDSLT